MSGRHERLGTRSETVADRFRESQAKDASWRPNSGDPLGICIVQRGEQVPVSSPTAGIDGTPIHACYREDARQRPSLLLFFVRHRPMAFQKVGSV